MTTSNAISPGPRYAVLLPLSLSLLFCAASARGEVRIRVEHIPSGEAAAAFAFTNVPPPSRSDAGTRAAYSLLQGRKDSNSGSLDLLSDGKLPNLADQPSQNFFFAAGTDGGRLLIELERPTDISSVNTYSWHPSERGPQVYTLYASDGKAADFQMRPPSGTDLEKAGWRRIAHVDTRSGGGGQHGVSISEAEGLLGQYRYLLFDIEPTETSNPFGNTFYSEIDVVESNGLVLPAVRASAAPYVGKSADGYCTFTIDTARAPELEAWARTELAPVLAEWYPKIAALLASDGFEAPKQFSVNIAPGDGVAATGGTRITANANWFKGELHREALGALVHEVVHVVQQYGGGRRGGSRPPGWLVEGIPDYIRFFRYEPQSHGADLIWMRGRRIGDLNYDQLYRVSANFLDYVIQHYDPQHNLLTAVNAACRQGTYSNELWQEWTGKALPELNEEWKEWLRTELAATPANTGASLTPAERAAGWRLLFNGRDFTGWHNFKTDGVRAGWQIKDGALVCADPHDAGDLVTTEKFAAFELELEYKISEGGNSGIFYHVTDEGGAVWFSGPEFQLEDNAKAADPQRCGWLYGLYQPPEDPATGKPLDATKPAGEWNQVRLVVSPKECAHYINGVKYLDYVIGSEDFNRRVAASKFSKMPPFAKSGTGFIALQGDHGQVSFRHIKIRPLDNGPQEPAEGS